MIIEISLLIWFVSFTIITYKLYRTFKTQSFYCYYLVLLLIFFGTPDNTTEKTDMFNTNSKAILEHQKYDFSVKDSRNRGRKNEVIPTKE